MGYVLCSRNRRAVLWLDFTARHLFEGEVRQDKKNSPPYSGERSEPRRPPPRPGDLAGGASSNQTMTLYLSLGTRAGRLFSNVGTQTQPTLLIHTTVLLDMLMLSQKSHRYIMYLIIFLLVLGQDITELQARAGGKKSLFVSGHC